MADQFDFFEPTLNGQQMADLAATKEPAMENRLPSETPSEAEELAEPRDKTAANEPAAAEDAAHSLKRRWEMVEKLEEMRAACLRDARELGVELPKRKKQKKKKEEEKGRVMTPAQAAFLQELRVDLQQRVEEIKEHRATLKKSRLDIEAKRKELEKMEAEPVCSRDSLYLFLDVDTYTAHDVCDDRT
ncbi:hypothetical protein UA08_00236 [Talaromyces atroroseus]|uniref:Uncharacterized protein n=1 Tax=Talaromyces atroroseus TaxID=1441469 RepID=A0A225AXD4_TALAT|nr:hypothetical protein UA08_00236 [Talaromyces atroroseus]OKL64273.1 hypothetical protein UA08_00236 [Talaromyces atroroseus]